MPVPAWLLRTLPALLPSDPPHLRTDLHTGINIRSLSLSLHMVQIFDNMARGTSMGSTMRHISRRQPEPMRVQQLRLLGLLAHVAPRVQPVARQIPLRPPRRKHHSGVSCRHHRLCGLLARSYPQYPDMGLRLSRLHPT